MRYLNKKKFVFAAYMSPPPAGVFEMNENFITEEHYNNVYSCGFDRLIGIYEDKIEQARLALELSDKLGLEYMLCDRMKGYSIEGAIKELYASGGDLSVIDRHASEIRTRLDEYITHPSFAGILAFDEPHSGLFSSIHAVQSWYEKEYPGYEFEINLLPDYANGFQLTGVEGAPVDYQKHLEDFVRVIKPHYISYDHYALMKDKEREYIRPSYLKNLQSVAKAAKENNLDFFVFLLTLGHWSFRTVSDYSEIAWQVYTAMAYGAKGAQTFTYWTMLGYKIPNNDNVTTALVSPDGKLLPAWYAMQEVISEVRAFEADYLDYTWERTLCFSPQGAEENPLMKGLDVCPEQGFEVRTDTDIIVGVFTKGQQKAYLFANLSDPGERRAANIEININGADACSICLGGKNMRKDLKNACLLTLRSGQGCFMLIENSY